MNLRWHFSVVLLACSGLAVYCGCNGQPSRIRQVKIDIEEASQAAVEQFDQDKNGSISTGEAKKSPPISRNFSSIDTDGNGELGVDEIKERLGRVFNSDVGLLSASCLITLGGQPLEGAKVRFIPVSFLAEFIPSAEGISKRNGRASISTKHEDLPRGSPKSSGLVRSGLYRVEITHPTQTIPAKYNVETSLGQEVSLESVRGGAFRYNL